MNEIGMIPSLVQLIAGGLLLGAGKKLYWFFVGLCGAAMGLFISEFFFHPTGWWQRVLVAVAIGAGFAILALILQRIMVNVGGFIAGGFLGISLLDTLQFPITNWKWAVFFVGGIIGVLIVQLLFDLSLILISSLAGATLINRAIGLEGTNGLIILLVLILAGIIIQSAQNRPKPLATPPVTR